MLTPKKVVRWTIVQSCNAVIVGVAIFALVFILVPIKIVEWAFSEENPGGKNAKSR